MSLRTPSALIRLSIRQDLEPKLLAALQARLSSTGRLLIPLDEAGSTQLTYLKWWLFISFLMAMLLWGWDSALEDGGATVFIPIGWWFILESTYLTPLPVPSAGSLGSRRLFEMLPIDPQILLDTAKSELLESNRQKLLGALARGCLAATWLISPVVRSHGWLLGILLWGLCSLHLGSLTISLRLFGAWVAKRFGTTAIFWITLTGALFLVPIVTLGHLNHQPPDAAGLTRWISQHRTELTWLLPPAWASAYLGALSAPTTWLMMAASALVIGVGLYGWKRWFDQLLPSWNPKPTPPPPVEIHTASFDDIRADLAQPAAVLWRKQGWMERVILLLCRRQERLALPVLNPGLISTTKSWLNAGGFMLRLLMIQLALTWEAQLFFGAAPITTSSACLTLTLIFLYLSHVSILIASLGRVTSGHTNLPFLPGRQQFHREQFFNHISLPMTMGFPISNLQRAQLWWRLWVVTMPALFLLILPGIFLAKWQLELDWDMVIIPLQVMWALSIGVSLGLYMRALQVNMQRCTTTALPWVMLKTLRIGAIILCTVPLITFVLLWRAHMHWWAWFGVGVVEFIVGACLLHLCYAGLYKIRGLDLISKIKMLKPVAVPASECASLEDIRKALAETTASRFAAQGPCERVLLRLCTPHQRAVLPLLVFRYRDHARGWRILSKMLPYILGTQFFLTWIARSSSPMTDFSPLAIIFFIALSVIALAVLNQKPMVAPGLPYRSFVGSNSMPFAAGFPTMVSDQLLILVKSLLVSIGAALLFISPMFALALIQLQPGWLQAGFMIFSVVLPILFFALLFFLSQSAEPLKGVSRSEQLSMAPLPFLQLAVYGASFAPGILFLRLWHYFPGWSLLPAFIAIACLCVATIIWFYQSLYRGRSLDLISYSQNRRHLRYR